MKIQNIIPLNNSYFIITNDNGYVFKIPTKIAGDILSMSDEDFKQFEVPLEEYEGIIKDNELKFKLIDWCDCSYKTQRQGLVRQFNSGSIRSSSGKYLNLTGYRATGTPEFAIDGSYQITEDNVPFYNLLEVNEVE